MLICMSCKCTSEERELKEVFDRVPYGEGYVDSPAGCVCPHCGGDDLREAAECKECGEMVAADTLDNELCEYCVNDLIQTLKWMWDMLSPEQQEWACDHCNDWMEG